tara:strand:+ start:4328 stop:5323 length:996 start_codon:yes stop_codon:yes gene_type:complete
MPKVGTGNVKFHEKKNKYEAFIPASWNHLHKRKTLGTFHTQKDAWHAIQLFYEMFVMGRDTVCNCDEFDPPGRIVGRKQQVDEMRRNSTFICIDCAVEFHDLIDNQRIRCASCVKTNKQKYNYQVNQDLNEEQIAKIKQAKKKYNNSAKGKAKLKAYRETNKDKYQECAAKSSMKYRNSQLGKETKRNYMQKFYEKSNNRISRNIAVVLRETLKGTHKSVHTIQYTGLSSGEELMRHLETTFQPGMTRENYGIPKDGSMGWVIDHIIPKALYDHTDETEIYKCWNYKNLQALWKSDNEAKGSKLTSEIYNVPLEYWPVALTNLDIFLDKII